MPGLTPLPWRVRHRGALVVILVVIVAAVAVGYGYVLWEAENPPPCPPEPISVLAATRCCGGGVALSLGSPYAGSGPHPTVWFENLSVESASSDLFLGDLAFQVETSTGGSLTTPSGSVVQVLSAATGLVLATYTLASGSWNASASTTHVTSIEVISLVWTQGGTTDPLAGDRLAVSGSSGGCSLGTLSITLQ